MTWRIAFLFPAWMLGAAPLFVGASDASGQEVRSFTNSTFISIVDEVAATPYPSTISVSGFTGELSQVTLTLRGLSHSYPDDIDILLVGPGGIKVMLMSDAGGSFPIDEAILTLDDSAAKQLPNSAQIVSGLYSPANWGGTAGDGFPVPAPGPPYLARLSSFNGIRPNGSWSLFVRDDIPENSGIIENGWSLTLRAMPPAPPPLFITRSGTNALISWPITAFGYTLEGQLRLGSSDTWTTVTNSVTTTNGEQRVTIPLEFPQQFFRLRR